MSSLEITHSPDLQSLPENLRSLVYMKISVAEQEISLWQKEHVLANVLQRIFDFQKVSSSIEKEIHENIRNNLIAESWLILYLFRKYIKTINPKSFLNISISGYSLGELRNLVRQIQSGDLPKIVGKQLPSPFNTYRY